MSALSYWHDSLLPGDDLTPRTPLAGDREADVAIVGAGYSGLWTAYYLLRADPHLRVVVLERDTAGFGASGRNGGWCVGDGSGPLGAIEKTSGAEAVRAMIGELHQAVDEVGAVISSEQIDCGFTKSGAVFLARTEAQMRRLRARQAEQARYGHADSYRLLSASETTSIVNAADVIGGSFLPHAGPLHPGRLARGLATAVERRGGVIHERTAVRHIDRGRVRTDRGTVRAEVVVRATEGYTSSIAGYERHVAPIGNFVIATEPLSDATWAEIGLSSRELFEDSSPLLGYGQRTHDGRIVWGGQSAGYWYRSRPPTSPMRDAKATERLRSLLVAVFPSLDDVEITHEWGGVLGASRDLRPSVGFDRATGLAWLGSYFGAGVAPSNAAARTLVDLVNDVDSHRRHLPWTNHRSRRWEPEPLRWLGITTMATAAKFTNRKDQPPSSRRKRTRRGKR